jgi:hypothetical protein
LQFITSINGRKSIIGFPNPQKGVTVGSVWTGLLRTTGLVTVAINMNPPPEEQLFEEEVDNFAFCSSNEDSDF